MRARRNNSVADARATLDQPGPSGTLKIASPATGNDGKWLSLRLRLWPHGSESEHLRDMANIMARGHYVRLALAHDGSAIGFVEASKRVDYVNGTSSSPVVFIEGLYVEPAMRRKGIARALVAGVEQWALAEHCAEIASDSPLDNVVAHAAHRAFGFEETERVVYFRRAVQAPLDDLAAAFPLLVPAAIAWAENQSRIVIEHGDALKEQGMALARRVGVCQPERIRMGVVDRVPLPDDVALRNAAIKTGLLGADTIGLTLGYAVLICRGHEATPRLLSHEFRHVHQYEIAGSIAAFLPGYLQQILAYGYANAPLEIDARNHEMREENS
jgi:GNAT superfamily N-acetyltransferase